jgi:hypothetical protein
LPEDAHWLAEFAAGRHDDQVDSTGRLARAKRRPATAGMIEYWRRTQ